MIQCYFLIKFSSVTGKKVHYLIYAAIFLLLTTLGMSVAIPQSVSTMIGILASLVFPYFILKQNFVTSAVIAAVVVTVNVFVECVVTPVLSLLSNLPGFPTIAADLITGIAMLLLTYIFLDFFAKRYQMKSGSGSRYLLIVVPPLLFISVILRMLLELKYSPLYSGRPPFSGASLEEYQFFGLVLIAFLCVCSVLFSFERVIRYFQTEKERSLLEVQLSLQKTYVEEAKSRYQLTRTFRHDFKNHLIALKGLLDRQDFSRAADYLERFEEISRSISFTVNTGKEVLDILLGEKLTHAESLEIDISCDIMIPPAVTIEDFDLCTLFSNAVDNAIRACCSVTKEKRKLDIAARQNGNFLMIDILNNYEPGRVLKGSGLGIPAIRDTVEKYHGIAETTEEGDSFRVSILLPVCSSAEASESGEMSDSERMAGEL